MIGLEPTYWSQASRTFEGHSGLFWAYRWRFVWNYDWYCLLESPKDTRAAINTWGLWNRVAWIEESHTLHGTRHTAGFRCIAEQSRSQRPHQVLGSPWARSAIRREWKRRHWDESKASKRGQLWNQWGVGHETRLSKDNWENTYFKIFWKCWIWPSYSRECLLCWLR